MIVAVRARPSPQCPPPPRDPTRQQPDLTSTSQRPTSKSRSSPAIPCRGIGRSPIPGLSGRRIRRSRRSTLTQGNPDQLPDRSRGTHVAQPHLVHDPAQPRARRTHLAGRPHRHSAAGSPVTQEHSGDAIARSEIQQHPQTCQRIPRRHRHQHERRLPMRHPFLPVRGCQRPDQRLTLYQIDGLVKDSVTIKPAGNSGSCGAGPFPRSSSRSTRSIFGATSTNCPGRAVSRYSPGMRAARPGLRHSPSRPRGRWPPRVRPRDRPAPSIAAAAAAQNPTRPPAAAAQAPPANPCPDGRRRGRGCEGEWRNPARIRQDCRTYTSCVGGQHRGAPPRDSALPSGAGQPASSDRVIVSSRQRDRVEGPPPQRVVAVVWPPR